jgi:hypothetical protein
MELKAIPFEVVLASDRKAGETVKLYTRTYQVVEADRGNRTLLLRLVPSDVKEYWTEWRCAKPGCSGAVELSWAGPSNEVTIRSAADEGPQPAPRGSRSSCSTSNVDGSQRYATSK